MINMKGGGFTFKKKDDNQPKVENSLYFGCPDLDRIFDFQLNKGSTVLLLEESLSKHSVALGRYFAGYGLTQGERTALFDLDVSFWKHLIPKPMEKKKLARKGETTGSKPTKTAEKVTTRIFIVSLRILLPGGTTPRRSGLARVNSDLTM